MTNKQYKRIDKYLQKAVSQGDLLKEDLHAIRALLKQDQCIGCKYNDGCKHYECHTEGYCKLEPEEESLYNEDNTPKDLNDLYPWDTIR